ncbi:MAG TPA: substrate-binding domain-containing protein [Pyrinomonadaceae bacterium]|jgi:D-xylose transport system substrate-binding protein|nr:substrate-binding domain-containing protein [Pyrinomonadaceae bacterium]
MRNEKGLFTLIFIAALLMAGCVSGPQDSGGGKGASGQCQRNPNGPVKIGFSMDTLKEERWQRDKELVEARGKERGAQIIVQVANGDDKVQTQQAENLLTQCVDVLLVAPHNGEIAASIVESAKRQGVPVISYDRLIRNSDVDLYVSHQVSKIGEMQAQYALDYAPTGNYVLVKGSETDNNAILLNQGQMKVLDPAVASGKIKIVANQFAKEWKAIEALNIVENALTQNNNNIVAVVASNDGTAGGAIEALEGQKLAGKVIVTGQDADLAACQRIVAGKQSMTIYKPIKPLADSAVDAAISLAHHETVDAKDKINNGKKDVPSILQEPISVDKKNIDQTIIKDGYQKLEAVYQNVPKDQWPKTTASDERKTGSSLIIAVLGSLFSLF